MTFEWLQRAGWRAPVFCVLLLGATGALAATPSSDSKSTTTAVTSAGDAIKAGDEVKLTVDAPIFVLRKVSQPNKKAGAAAGAGAGGGAAAGGGGGSWWSCGGAAAGGGGGAAGAGAGGGAAAGEAAGAGGAPNVTPATPEDSANNKASGVGNDGQVTYLCAPAGSHFRVTDIESPQTTVTGKQGNTTVTAGSQTNPSGGQTTDTTGLTDVSVTQSDTVLDVHFPSPRTTASWTPLHWWRTHNPSVRKPPPSDGKDPKSDAKDPQPAGKVADGECDPTQLVQEGVQYTVSATNLAKYGSTRFGFTWGALVIPYKFETRDHSFQASPSAAGYVGYEGWWPGVSVAHVLALGGGAYSSSNTTTTPATGGTTTSSTTSQTRATYTAAIGEIATLGGSFKAGILVGKDWQGRDAGFKYEGGTWIAVTLGVGF